MTSREAYAMPIMVSGLRGSVCIAADHHRFRLYAGADRVRDNDKSGQSKFVAERRPFAQPSNVMDMPDEELRRG